MTRATLLPFGVAKEVRALLPAWLACLGVLSASAAVSDPRIRVFAVLAFGVGSVALGALSIGHEYTHRTLTQLLSQPVGRGRLYLVKLGVLAAMLLPIGAVAYGVVFNTSELPSGFTRSAMLWLLPVLCGLFIAPLLTMMCRGPLAGMVFAIAVPGVTVILIDVLLVATYGMSAAGTPELQRLRLVVLSQALLGFSGIAAVLGWRMFMRLEAIEGRDPELHLFVPLASADARARHPLWLLAKKELRLQQMSLVVAGLYLPVWSAESLFRYLVPDFPGPPLAVISVLYGGLLAMLIGSLASAEERQLGTLEWQLLLPIATWKQWAVKAGTALGLATLLSFVLPALLAAGQIRINEWHLGVVMLLTVGSLYVSSVSGSGLRALLLSLPVMLVVLLLLGWVGFLFEAAPPFRPGSWTILWRSLHSWLPLVLLTGFLAVVLRFALENHRSGERGARRVWQQVFWMGGCLALSFALLVVVRLVVVSAFR
jgi:hypothetical protein